MPDLRRQRRVVYHAKIRLRSPGREQSVVARVQNLSTSGVFVTGRESELPAAGTEVLCRMLVAGERCTFKGFVAWVRPAGTEGARDGGPGAGIQFIDVSDREAELLAKLIQPDASDRQAVDVWFEGMGAPIKSHASITDDALSISTKLPFLRLNSPVRVSFSRRGVDETRSGILEAVTLEPSAEDGIPRLQLTVSTPLADSAYGTIDVPAAAGWTPPEGMLVREPRTVVDPMTIETPPPTAVEVAPAPEPTPPPVLERRATDQDRTPRVVRASEPITLVPPTVPMLAPSVRPPATASKVIMGLVTIGVTGALGYLLWSRPQPPVPHAERQTPVESRPKIEPLPGRRIDGQTRPARPVAAATAPSTAAPVAVAPAAAPPAPVTAPEADPPAMALALVGSAKGMQSYRLAEPPGLAINLPHGYPKPGVRASLPTSMFTKVVISRKGSGSQLRLYFAAGQNADVAADGNALRFTPRPKRARKA